MDSKVVDKAIRSEIWPALRYIPNLGAGVLDHKTGSMNPPHIAEQLRRDAQHA